MVWGSCSSKRGLLGKMATCWWTVPSLFMNEITLKSSHRQVFMLHKVGEGERSCMWLLLNMQAKRLLECMVDPRGADEPLTGQFTGTGWPKQTPCSQNNPGEQIIF